MQWRADCEVYCRRQLTYWYSGVLTEICTGAGSVVADAVACWRLILLFSFYFTFFLPSSSFSCFLSYHFSFFLPFFEYFLIWMSWRQSISNYVEHRPVSDPIFDINGVSRALCTPYFSSVEYRTQSIKTDTMFAENFEITVDRTGPDSRIFSFQCKYHLYYDNHTNFFSWFSSYRASSQATILLTVTRFLTLPVQRLRWLRSNGISDFLQANSG
jgi:hypothetical protein